MIQLGTPPTLSPQFLPEVLPPPYRGCRLYISSWGWVSCAPRLSPLCSKWIIVEWRLGSHNGFFSYLCSLGSWIEHCVYLLKCCLGILLSHLLQKKNQVGRNTVFWVLVFLCFLLFFFFFFKELLSNWALESLVGGRFPPNTYCKWTLMSGTCLLYSC